VKNSYSLGFLYFFEGKKIGGTVGSRNLPRVSVRSEWIFFFYSRSEWIHSATFELEFLKIRLSKDKPMYQTFSQDRKTYIAKRITRET
jgi:hypothetical protein